MNRINCICLRLRNIPKYLIYDNACGLLLTLRNRLENGKIKRSHKTDALYEYFFSFLHFIFHHTYRSSITFAIDKFHIGNHKRPMCINQTNPYKFTELKYINTVVCEQTNSKLKKYQNAFSSFSLPKSKVFYLLLFNLINCKKTNLSIYT